ncbi:MAG: class I SAM-dependent methyltransferase [Defluviimonas sp.]|uniref:class I SAM-dependent DNA methyltransferase n=1 Tax=Albidovulum sp. TaxID=1872424 RepID=UPI002A3333D8|nr:class I SAM-dependent methyltransferase [Defluviimonas sp.]
MDDDEHGLDAAYALRTPQDSLRYYAGWAERYDSAFAGAMDYRAPAIIAAAYAALGGDGPVLDVGAGTGLVAEALGRIGIGPVDGVDISAEMLAKALAKGVCRATVVADLTQPLPIADGAYRGIVSAGTFTTGHVGPEAFGELLRVSAPGALFAISVHSAVYQDRGFAAAFAALDAGITGFRTESYAIYGPGADGAHRDDRGWIVSFRKAV